MKRKDLISRLTDAGFVLKRHGGEHDIYVKGDITVVVPRHAEINEITAKKILKQAGLL